MGAVRRIGGESIDVFDSKPLLHGITPHQNRSPSSRCRHGSNPQLHAINADVFQADEFAFLPSRNMKRNGGGTSGGCRAALANLRVARGINELEFSPGDMLAAN
jgi:hypothetical protein